MPHSNHVIVISCVSYFYIYVLYKWDLSMLTTLRLAFHSLKIDLGGLSMSVYITLKLYNIP